MGVLHKNSPGILPIYHARVSSPCVSINGADFGKIPRFRLHNRECAQNPPYYKKFCYATRFPVLRPLTQVVILPTASMAIERLHSLRKPFWLCAKK
jgi:hypothetical protein